MPKLTPEEIEARSKPGGTVAQSRMGPQGIAKAESLEGMSACVFNIPELSDTECEMLQAAIFQSQALVAKRFGVDPGVVRRLVLKYRDLVERARINKVAVLEHMAQSIMFIGLEQIQQSLVANTSRQRALSVSDAGKLGNLLMRVGSIAKDLPKVRQDSKRKGWQDISKRLDKLAKSGGLAKVIEQTE